DSASSPGAGLVSTPASPARDDGFRPMPSVTVGQGAGQLPDTAILSALAGSFRAGGSDSRLFNHTLSGEPKASLVRPLHPEPNAAANPVLDTAPPPNQSQLLESYGSLPLSFEANQGQTDVQVDFLSRGPGYSLFLTSTEAVLVLAKPTGPRSPGGEAA